MRRAYSAIIFLAITGTRLIFQSPTHAAVWIGGAGNSWNTSANWQPGPVPNGVGIVADFSALDILANTFVTLEGNKTTGTLIFGDIAPSSDWFIGPGTPSTSTLTLDVSTGSPLIDVVNQAAILKVPIDGNDGLTKTGLGTLVLTRPNTYSGTTTVRSGTLVLDFADMGPPSNIVPSGSDLRLGGSTLRLIGASGVSNSQAFSGVMLQFGRNRIVVDQNGAEDIDLSLGPLGRDVGSTLSLTLPAVGVINADSASINGILGAWATIGSGTAASWAANDGAGNIVPYTAFTEVTGAPTIANAPTANVRWSGSTGDATLAAGVTDINTLLFADSARRTISIPASGTLRLGTSGGIFKTDDTAGEANSLLTVGTVGSFLTAAGTPNSVGELILNANSISPDQNGITVNATITNNGTAPVSVIKSGNASALLTSSNTYTNGTYITSGRLRTSTSGAFGTGPVYVAPSGQAYLDGGTITNNFFISGRGLEEPRDESGPGALRLAGNDATLTGKVTLLGDARIGGGIAAGNGGVISGQITGPFKVEFNSGSNGALTLTSPWNDWTGNTVIGPGVLRIGGAGDVLPNGVRQEVILNGDVLSGAPSVLDLNGKTETISGLSSTGDKGTTFIRNSAFTPATLRVGTNFATYEFGGVIEDGGGPVGLTKIHDGVQSLSGANTYTGPTLIEEGTLHLGSSQALPIGSHVQMGHRHSASARLDLGGFSPVISRP